MKKILYIFLLFIFACNSNDDNSDDSTFVENWENIVSVELNEFTYTANFNQQECTEAFNIWINDINNEPEPDQQCLSHSIETKLHVKYDAINYENSNNFVPYTYFKIKYKVKYIDDRLAFEYDNNSGRKTIEFEKEVPVELGTDTILTFNNDVFLKAGGNDPYYYLESVQAEFIEGSITIARYID